MTRLYDVYHGKGFPHRILQAVTFEVLNDWCSAHGFAHQAHRDCPHGAILMDAYVVPAN